MPLVEAGFYDKAGHPDKVLIEGYGPTLQVIVSHYSPDGAIVPLEFKTVRALIDTGAHLVAGGQPHEVLLGRTFLRNCIMIYDGLRGIVTIAAPSIPK